MDKVEVELKLAVMHVNVILKHLAKGAWEEVADVIAAIHAQAKPQVDAATAAAEATPPEQAE